MSREGWYFPPGSRKAHYFVEEDSGRSLCRKYGFFNAFELVQPDDGPSIDDCTECRKKVDRRKLEAPDDSA